MLFTKHVLRTVLLLLCVTKLHSAIETVNNRLNASMLFSGGALYVADNKWPLANLANSYSVSTAYTKLSFGIDERILALTGAHKTSVDFNIIWLDVAGTVHTVNNVTLSVEYDPAKGSNPLAYQNEYIIKGAHQVITLINKVYNTTTGTVYASGTVPANVYLESEQVTERYYKPGTFSTSTYHIFHSYLSATNELKIFWQQIPGAEEYDLEWTYVNDYDAVINTYAVSTMDFSFNNNATRVRTSDLSYKISLNYEHGYILYRLRPVSRALTGSAPYTVTTVEGAWTANDPAGPSSLTTPFNTLISNPTTFGSNIHFFYQLTPLDENKNIQYSATFAEEGKKKEVLSYFDGSLRNRQTVTKNNSENQVIIGQTYYDFQGRPAVNALPVPAYVSGTAAQTLKYYESFNLSSVLLDVSSSPAEFSRDDFDKDVTGTCPAPSNGMKNSTGASLYYSVSNPDKAGSQAYVPDAANYPFSQTVYMPDNTGRVRKQSGVGNEFKTGSGHETTNFYGVPLQQDLDELFGSEAGDAERYKKNTVIDPNGQMTISYLNKDGKVVATSLAGGTPPNLNSLIPGASVKTQKFLSSDDPNYQDVNAFDGSALVFSWPIVPTVSGAYTFSYNLQVQSYSICSLCYECDYTLEITIKDECGGILYPTGTVTAFPVTGGSGYSCSTPALAFNSSAMTPALSVYLSSGQQYYLEKKLTINSDSLNSYVNKYLSSSCVDSLASFTGSALATVSNSCNMDCDACSAAVDNFAASHTLTSDPEYLTTAQINQLKKQCYAACSTISKCETQFRLMLGDVAPSGQYGQYTATGNYDASAFPVSVYNTTNNLPQGLATANEPQPLFNSTLVSFLNSFVPSLGLSIGQFTSCYATLPSSQIASWRHPYFYNYSVHDFSVASGSSPDVYHYYDDENGIAISKIYLIEATPGVYSPVPTSTTAIKMDANGALYIYPEELANLKDFINNFRSSWSYSLVKYHPEWCYFSWCDVSATQIVFVNYNNYSSDDFDNALRSYVTWNDATTAGTGGPINNFTVANTVTDIVSTDPYFDSGSQGGGTINGNVAAGYLKSLMIDKLTHFATAPTGTGGTYNMNAKEAANMMTRFATMYSTPPVVYSASTMYSFGSSASVPGLTLNTSDITQLQDKEWATYRDFYLNTKAEVQAIGAHINAINKNNNSHCGCYDGCIGNANFDAYNLPGADYNGFASLQPFYYAGSTITITSAYTDGGYAQKSQPCNATDKTFYSTKQARFGSASDLLSTLNIPFGNIQEAGNTLAANGAYQVYQQTGQCPVAIKLQSFLGDMAKSGLFATSTTSINLYLHPSFDNDLYNMVIGAGASSYVPYNLVKTASGSSLTLSFVPSTSVGVTSTCSIILTGTGSWADITLLNDIQFTSSNAFKMTAFFSDPGAAPAIITGSSSCISSSCSFPTSVCHANQSAKDLVSLMNNVHQNMQNNASTLTAVYGSSYNIADPNSPESSFLSPALLGAMGISGSSPNITIPTFTFSSSFGLKLVDAANPTAYTEVHITAPGTIPIAINDVAYFGNLVPDQIDPCSFTVTAYYYTNTANASVTPSITVSTLNSFPLTGQITHNCFQLGDCAAPIPQSCNTPGYLTMLDLKKFLNELKTKNAASITASLNVAGYSNLTANLLGIFADPTGIEVTSFSSASSSVQITLGPSSGTGNSCSIGLKLQPGQTWANISSFDDFTADNTNDGVFSCSLTYTDGTAGTATGTCCYHLSNCDDCTQQDNLIFVEDFDRFSGTHPANLTLGSDFQISDNSNTVAGPTVYEFEYQKSPAATVPNNLGSTTPVAPSQYDIMHSTVTNIAFTIGSATLSVPNQHTPLSQSTATSPPPSPSNQDMMEVFVNYGFVPLDVPPTVYQKAISTPTPGYSYKISSGIISRSQLSF